MCVCPIIIPSPPYLFLSPSPHPLPVLTSSLSPHTLPLCQGVSNFLWALASTRCPDRALAFEIIQHARPLLNGFKVQNVRATLYSLGILGEV